MTENGRQRDEQRFQPQLVLICFNKRQVSSHEFDTRDRSSVITSLSLASPFFRELLLAQLH